MADDITVGEVYRVLLRMERNHGDRLSSIEEQTRKTNGNVGRHEVVLAEHGRQLKNIEREVFNGDESHERPPSVSSDFSMSLSPKMWAALASFITGLSLLAPVVVEWLKRLLLGSGAP